MITTEDLRDTFGWAEFERLAAKIINYLNDKSTDQDEKQNRTLHARGVGRNKVFFAYDLGLDKNEIEILVMFAASGWVSPAWYPSGLRVSEDFIERLKEKGIKW